MHQRFPFMKAPVLHFLGMHKQCPETPSSALVVRSLLYTHYFGGIRVLNALVPCMYKMHYVGFLLKQLI